jgi:hypothetical protein
MSISLVVSVGWDCFGWPNGAPGDWFRRASSVGAFDRHSVDVLARFVANRNGGATPVMLELMRSPIHRAKDRFLSSCGFIGKLCAVFVA